MTTNEKSPKVIIVRGNESNFRIGLTVEFNIPKIIARIIAYKKPLIVILSNKKSPINKIMAEINSLMIMFFIAEFFIKNKKKRLVNTQGV